MVSVNTLRLYVRAILELLRLEGRDDGHGRGMKGASERVMQPIWRGPAGFTPRDGNACPGCGETAGGRNSGRLEVVAMRS